MDSFDRGYPWLYHPILLCTSLDGQSIHGFLGYFDRQYPLVLPSNTTCTSLVSQSIHGYQGYFDRGYPLTLTANTTLYILGWSEYPWIPRILWQRVPLGSTTQYYFVHPWLVRVSMDSTDTLTESTPGSTSQYYFEHHPWMTDTLTEGTPCQYYFVHPRIVRVSMDSMDT